MEDHFEERKAQPAKCKIYKSILGAPDPVLTPADCRHKTWAHPAGTTQGRDKLSSWAQPVAES